jgi:hypothetical protein
MLAGRAMIGSVFQVPLEVEREAVGGFVAAGAILLQALHHDPVEVAAQETGKLAVPCCGVSRWASAPRHRAPAPAWRAAAVRPRG